MSYFRITAYHPQENISLILDSNGRFEKLWEFSAHLLQKGFKIIAEHAVKNLYRVLREGKEPMLEKENILPILKLAYKTNSYWLVTKCNALIKFISDIKNRR